MFSLTGMDEIISSYAAELVFLLAGREPHHHRLERTGVDKRVASMMLSLVGTSVKQQIAVWFLAATLLSAFLPNTVVAAILCSIAMSMLKFVNEGDLKKSRVAPLVLLAIVWGANNGGLMTPLGGAMNLVTVAYIEELTGTEFIYTDWVIQLLPMSIAITVVTLLVLLLTKCEQRTLEGSREYFREMHQAMPPIRREEVLSLAAFIAAAVLTFARELYKQWLPDLKPGYIFLFFGMLMFFLKDGKKKNVVTWEYAEKNLMWGLFFLFAGGTALGALVNRERSRGGLRRAHLQDTARQRARADLHHRDGKRHPLRRHQQHRLRGRDHTHRDRHSPGPGPPGHTLSVDSDGELQHLLHAADLHKGHPHRPRTGAQVHVQKRAW